MIAVGMVVYLPYAPLDAGVVLDVEGPTAKVLWGSGDITLLPHKDLQSLAVLIDLHRRKMDRHQQTILRLHKLAAERGFFPA